MRLQFIQRLLFRGVNKSIKCWIILQSNKVYPKLVTSKITALVKVMESTYAADHLRTLLKKSVYATTLYHYFFTPSACVYGCTSIWKATDWHGTVFET